MCEGKKIQVKEAILSSNDTIAQETNNTLTKAGIFTINVLGAPGAGKTSSIISIIDELEDVKPYVLEGDIESDIDTQKLTSLGINTIQINTHGACHLDAPIISSAIKGFTTDQSGVLFIENIGNLVCPAEFVIGEHIKMLILTVTEGSDKPYKYPLIFENADLILLNKSDLIPYVDFDEDFFMAGVRAINKNAPVIKVSSKDKQGFKEVSAWIQDQIAVTIQ